MANQPWYISSIQNNIMNNSNEIKAVSVIGAGSWGTSVAIVIAENNPEIDVRIWAYEKGVVSSINNKHENTEYLPGIQLPANIKAFIHLRDSVKDSTVVLIATPSKVTFDISNKIGKYLSKDAHVGYLSKGFCKINNEIFTISQTIEKSLPHLKGKVIAVSGPSHAEEVSRKFHTCLNIGGKSVESRAVFTQLLTSEFLQCRETEDILGVDLGGTLKNPAAIAAGMISVLPQCGDNLAGALISEALKEMINLGKIFHIEPASIVDISGLGDLVATALSNHSRNRRFGRDIGKQILQKGTPLRYYDKFLLKLKPEYVLERMSKNLHYLAEGAYAIEPLIELAEKHNVGIPVYRSLYEVLLNKKNPSLLIETIKHPEKFEEIYRQTRIQISDRKAGLENIKGKVFYEAIIQKASGHYSKISDDKAENIDEVVKIIEDLKEYLINTKSNKKTKLTHEEISIVNRLKQKNFISSIKILISVYIKEIVDSFNKYVTRLYLFYLKHIFISASIKKFNARKKTKGSIDEIKNIKKTENIIYISTFQSILDFILLIVTFNSLKLPFPRFFVNQRAIKNKFHKYIVKLSGGFIFDENKISNSVYLDTLYSYMATMIEHGVPILYFPELIPENPEFIDIADSFFNSLVETMFQNTIEIVMVPVEIIYRNSNDSKKLGKTKIDSPIINFSKPLYLSDFTKSPDSESQIAETVRSIWGKDIVAHSVVID